MITLHNNGVFLAGGVPAAAGPVSPWQILSTSLRALTFRFFPG